jgi:hypothetical protein
VKVSDPPSPACSRSLGALRAGASNTYVCESPPVKAFFTSLATVTTILKDVHQSARARALVMVIVATS